MKNFTNTWLMAIIISILFLGVYLLGFTGSTKVTVDKVPKWQPDTVTPNLPPVKVNDHHSADFDFN
jgi:cytochrome oxidase Cu insertion factor (SCO1/SenC/PrrC family)